MHSKVGVGVKAMVDFVATEDCLSLIQRRNNSSNNKTDYLDNTKYNSYSLMFADINMFPVSDTRDDNSHVDYNNKMPKPTIIMNTE